MERLLMQRIFLLTIGIVVLTGMLLLAFSLNTVQRIEANQVEIEASFEDLDARFEQHRAQDADDLSVNPSINKES